MYVYIMALHFQKHTLFFPETYVVLSETVLSFQKHIFILPETFGVLFRW